MQKAFAHRGRKCRLLTTMRSAKWKALISENRAWIRPSRGTMSTRKELGLKYLTGDGAPKLPEIGFEYLGKFAEEPGIAVALAAHAPLALFVRNCRLDILVSIAHRSSHAAAMLEVWQLLSGERAIAPQQHPGFQHLLKCGSTEIEMLLAEAYKQLPGRHCDLIEIALLTRAGLGLASAMLVEIIRAAESGQASLEPLTASQVRELLGIADESAFVHYILGRAQIGFPCGGLKWEQITPKLNYRAGYAHLLRAADQGECGAWYALYIASSDYRSVLANPSAAQFFLEKAAAKGYLTAQVALGVKTLRMARTVGDIVEGQRWLSRAWSQHDADAELILRSFGQGIADSNSSRAATTLAKIRQLDPLLAAILAVARQFGLTRKEAFGLRVSSCIQGGSLIFIPESKRAPFALPSAIEPSRVEAMRELVNCPGELLPADGAAFERRRAAQQRGLFSTYGFVEADFFREAHEVAQEHRDLSQWKALNSALLKDVQKRAHCRCRPSSSCIGKEE